MSLGAVRIDETIIPITYMRLVRNGVEFTMRIEGPCPPVEGNIRLFAGDGQPVTDLAAGPTAYAKVPRLREHDVATLTYTINFSVMGITR
jgi:hypothetical protein